MYGKIAKKITASLINNNIIQWEECSICEYSIEVLISDLIYFSLAILTAVFTRTLLETLLFYAGFFSTRKYAGGYHADSYWIYHLLFLANQFAMILLQAILSEQLLSHITGVIISISVFCIFLFAPVANVNRPFTEQEKRNSLYSVESFQLLLLLVLRS